MIELMLQAERNLAMGLVDQAERLYRQVLERDPRNAIAVVGLARVAIARDDDRGAYSLAIDALRIDPQNAAAIKLEGRLAELFMERGDSFEREPFAVRLAQAESERTEEYLRSAARSSPPPAAGRPDYAPSPGTRFEQVVAAEAAPQPAAAPPTQAATPATATAPPTAMFPSSPPPTAPEPSQEPQPAPVAADSAGPESPADDTTGEAEERPGLLKRLFGIGRNDK